MTNSKLSKIIRLILSILILFSGMFKLFSINAFINSVRLYTDSYFISLNNTTLYILSYCICIYELLLGVVGLCSRFKITSLMLLSFTFGVFSFVTGINLFFPTSLGPIGDCNCFGDLIHFTPLETLMKSIILLFLSLLALVLEYKPMRNIISLRTTLVVGILFCFTTIHAQRKAEGRIMGGVDDSFTNVGLPAFVTLLNKDSVIIDTTRCKVYKGNSFFEFYIPKVAGNYMLRVEHPGYKTAIQKQYIDFDKSYPGYGFPPIKLKRLPNAVDSMKAVGLDEVVVRGTRLQVAYRGDTLVYDAQAFNIPEGAMLDALVRQLPGAELKANGDVYISGKRLDYITLNGNDFFKGNNKVILENLPYFVVKELQVYYKDPPFALTKPLTDDGKDYVLDVVMKREYEVGTIVNAELGAGTKERWKAKAFGLRYDDYSRLAVFTNLNNVNENRTPGNDGDWSPSKQSRGLLTTKQVGANLNFNNAKKTLSLDQSAILEWSDNTTTTQRNSETFASNGNIMGHSASLSRIKDFTIKDKTQFNIRIGRSVLSSNLNLTYINNNGTDLSQDSTFSPKLINTDHYMSLTDSRRIFGNGYAGWSFRFNSPYSLSISTNFSFSNNWRNKSHTLRNITYHNSGLEDGRNDYRDNTASNYRYSIETQHNYRLSSRVRLSYRLGYEQSGNDYDNDYYRLYNYGGRYTKELILPSTTDSLQAALDIDNTYDYFTLGRGVTNDLSVQYSWKKTSVFLSATYKYTHERMRYSNMALDTIARRNYGTWNPNIGINHKWGKNTLKMHYMSISTQPGFNLLMPMMNTSNPLNRRINNPDLKSQVKHSVKAEFDHKIEGRKPAWWIKYEYNSIGRAWGNRVDYDTSTGVYTSVADNVNGNWNTSLNFGINGPIDKKKRWRYDVSAQAGYIHSVDYNIAYNGEDNELSRVNTFKPKATMKLNYRQGNFSAGLTALFSGNFSHEEEYGRRDMNVKEYQLGGRTQYTIPVVKLSIGTDMTLYSRNGYNSSVMNTDDWVWNAFVSRPLLKGRFVAKVELYDILHQLSARSYSVNAQSRVEYFYNNIPHYAMFSLSYKFAKPPKKN